VYSDFFLLPNQTSLRIRDTSISWRSIASDATRHFNMPSFRSQLVGAWELVSVRAHKEDDPSDVILPMGPNPRGIIMYTNDGHMSCQQQEPGAPLYSGTRDFGDGTATELAETAKRYLAYSGPYFLEEIDGEPPKLWHGMTVSLVPNWVGQVQKRVVEITEEGGEKFLILAPEKAAMTRGEVRVVQIKWRRLPENHASSPP
jgi:Lipocalin-like domain